MPTPATPDVLDVAMRLVERAYAQRSSTIDATIYESLARYVSNDTERGSDKGGRRSANQGDKENGAALDEASLASRVEPELLERFLEKAVAVFFSHDSSRDYSTDPERVRKLRVALALALSRNQLGSESSRASLAAILDKWHASERSKPLREELQSATQRLREPPEIWNTVGRD